MKNKKLKTILSITGYFLLAVALCFTGGLVFHSYYYQAIYVSGISMMPTLYGQTEDKNGAVVDFGIMDTHSIALNNLKRFDIISTYYAKDYDDSGALKINATKKIKRIIALPGEEFKIENGSLSVKENGVYKKYDYPVKIEETNVKDTKETLKENEYWVLGDNRTHSNDSASSDVGPIKKEYIIGKLIAIEGRATLKLKNYVCDYCGKTSNSKSVCSKCGSIFFTENYDLKNKVYHWPKYF